MVSGIGCLASCRLFKLRLRINKTVQRDKRKRGKGGVAWREKGRNKRN
jgi:hypothetical protein